MVNEKSRVIPAAFEDNLVSIQCALRQNVRKPSYFVVKEGSGGTVLLCTAVVFAFLRSCSLSPKMVCGPKCVGFVMGISLWGLILMVILGGLFYNESVGLLSDLPAESPNTDKSNWQARRQEIKDLYYQNALNSWIAGAIHLAIFVAAGLRMCCLR